MQTMQTAVDDFELELEPLVQAQMLADWESAIDASDANEQQLVEASKRVDAVLSEPERYARLVEADGSGAADGELARRVRLARLTSEAGQRDRALADRIIEAEARLGSLFSRHRGRIAGREVNDNEIAKIMRESTDRAERRAAWDASKSIGPQAAPGVRELAHLRNEAARALGYRDHFEFSLTLEELDEDWLMTLLDELDVRLAGTWEREKAAIDDDQRARLGLAAGRAAAALGLRRRVLPGRPDDAPATRSRRRSRTSIPSRSRAPTSGRSATTSTACSSAATSIRATARTSTRSAPTSTAATTCACSPTASRASRWLGTMVHELGHAVYDLAIDPELPWILRQPAHTFTTEAIAMLHGRLVRDETFLERFARIDPAIARDARNIAMQRRELLVFVPWVQVMTRFERELYRDPDQDLGAVWWQLVERYQRIAPPGGPAARRLGLQAPRRAGAGLLPELPAGRDHGVAARLGAGARDRRPSPAVAPAAAGEFLREHFMRPGLVAALGRADRAGDGHAALGRPPRELARRARRTGSCALARSGSATLALRP